MTANNKHLLDQFCTHLVFADREMAPNIGPILDKRLTVKRVLITYTANLIENAKRLKVLYKAHKIKAELHLIEPDFEIGAIVSSLQSLVQNIPYETLSINLSCADKLYTLGAFKAFENTPVGLYYLLPNDQLKWIQPSGLPEFNIAENIQLGEFLRAHGVEQMWPVKLTPGLADFANKLVNAIEKIILKQYALKTYQKFSTHFARGKPVKLIKHNERYYLNEVANPLPIAKTDQIIGFLKKLHNQNVLHLKFEQDAIYPLPEKDPWKRTFFEGGWLEYLTYRTLIELKAELPKIKEVAFGVKMQRKSAFDEADVLFIANNQLFVIECKTGSNANINLHLQRLDSLSSRLGGATAHSLLITTQVIGANRPKADLLNVGVIGGRQLARLKHHLREWIVQEMALTPENID